MKKILYLLLICCMTINVLGLNYIIGDQPTLKAPCTSNGQTCEAAGLTCNITVTYPNSSYYINDQQMLFSGYYATYDVGTPLNTLGTYSYTTYCHKDNLGNITTGTFTVLNNNYNYGGNDLIDFKYISFLMIFSFALLAVFIYNKNVVFGIASSATGLISGLYVWFYGLNITTDTIGLYYSLNTKLSNGIGIIMTFFFLWVFYIAFANKPNEDKKRKKDNEAEYAEEEED